MVNGNLVFVLFRLNFSDKIIYVGIRAVCALQHDKPKKKMQASVIVRLVPHACTNTNVKFTRIEIEPEKTTKIFFKTKFE